MRKTQLLRIDKKKTAEKRDIFSKFCLYNYENLLSAFKFIILLNQKNVTISVKCLIAFFCNLVYNESVWKIKIFINSATIKI